jgi:N-acetylmuramidase/Putative peptidoglycan binding domain
MATLPFPSRATPLTAPGIQNAITTLGIDEPTLWAMLHVESSQVGYLNDRRPQILFERHIFSRLTGGAYDATDPGISNPVPGGYGASGAAQYPRLGEAAALAQDAALQSASWGLGQVMGENFALGGYAGVEAMVADMCSSEDAQLAMMVEFIVHNNLAAALQTHNWAAYAHGYNGPNYAAQQYDVRLANAWAAFSAGQPPHQGVRTAQVLLNYLGFNVAVVDGEIGPNTLTSLHAFQSAQGVALTQTIDAAVLASLAAALPPPANLLLA